MRKKEKKVLAHTVFCLSLPVGNANSLLLGGISKQVDKDESNADNGPQSFGAPLLNSD